MEQENQHWKRFGTKLVHPEGTEAWLQLGEGKKLTVGAARKVAK